MSVSKSEDLEAKLKDLECLFTWGVEKSEIRYLDDISEKLLDRIKYCPPKYHPTYFNILAFLSHLDGRTEAALDYLRKAEEALREDKRDEADFLVTLSGFAWVHFHGGDLAQVKVYLGKVKSIHKTVPCSPPTVHGEKGWSFLRLGGSFYEGARESFSKALEAEPDNVSFNVGYAVVLYRLEGMNRGQQHRHDDSATVLQLRKALELEPTNAEIMVLLALKLQYRKGHEAHNLIKEALKRSPDVPQVTRYVAKYFRAAGSIDTSLEILHKAVSLSPNSSFLHHQIGLCHKQQLLQMFDHRGAAKRIPAAKKAAKAEECIHHFSKAVELKPTNVHARVNLAEAYGENRQLSEAEQIFTSLLQDDSLSLSERQHCLTTYGAFLLYKKKDKDGAVSHFKMAYKIPIDGYDKKQAGKKLRMIAGRRLNMERRVNEVLEILMGAEENIQVEGCPRGTNQHSSDTDGLAEAFAKNLRIKK